MIPRFDFGHFFKFLASVGLALIAAAVVAPWLFATTSGALTIPQAELEQLTPIAQEVLSGRQVAMKEVQSWLPLLSGGLALIGVLMLIWGLLGWRQRQKVSDEAEDVELRTKSANYDKLTAGEAEEKLREEVEEEVLEEDRTASALSDTATPPSSNDTPKSPSTDSRIHDRMEERRKVESHVAALLRDGFSAGLALATGVRLKTPSGSDARIDFLIESKQEASSWGQLAVELRFTSNRVFGASLPGWMVTLAMASSSLARAKVFTGLRGRPVDATTSGVLLLILRKRDSDNLDVRVRARRLVAEVNRVLRTPVGVVLLLEEELETISPERLRALIADAWSTEGEATTSSTLALAP